LKFIVNFLKIASRVGLGISAQDVHNLIIWGNHSNTQFPDASHASVTIDGKDVKVADAIKDDHWLKNEFISVRLFFFTAVPHFVF